MAGAFGGMGGSAAFGVKTADVLSLITRWLAGFFFVLAIAIGMANVEANKKPDPLGGKKTSEVKGTGKTTNNKPKTP